MCCALYKTNFTFSRAEVGNYNIYIFIWIYFFSSQINWANDQFICLFICTWSLHSTVYHVLQAVIYYLLLALEIYIAIKTSKNNQKSMCMVVYIEVKATYPMKIYWIWRLPFWQIFLNFKKTVRKQKWQYMLQNSVKNLYSNYHSFF